MSFIIIGLGKKTFKDLGETGQPQQCFSCSVPVFNHLILVRTWFTYFFIPIFSYRREYRIECPACSCSVTIYGDEIRAAKRGELQVYTELTFDNSETPQRTLDSFGQQSR
jgi:hypothetical protein